MIKKVLFFLFLVIPVFLISCSQENNALEELINERTEKDSDDDGLTDATETEIGTDPLLSDTDGDGVIDGKEIEDTTNPLENCSFILASQTTTASTVWLALDCDEDGFTNGEEIENNTNPLVADTTASLLIVGTWNLEDAYIEDGTATTVIDGVTLNIEYTSTSSDENVTLIFTENPNEVSSSGTYTSTIEFTVLGTRYTDEVTSETPLSEGSWDIADSVLSVDGDTEESSGDFQILEISRTTLKLKSAINQVVNAGGADLDTTGDLILTFNKE